MQSACIPTDESARLLSLRRSGVLGSPSMEAFDYITRLAAQALSVPIALLSLVDGDRQVFKSRVGLDVSQTSREVSFCAHAVFQRTALVVPDATLDERFADNPLVTGPPHIRAYAGVPLSALDGQPIGTLCVIDVRPRHFSREALATLTDHGRIMESLLQERERSVAAAAALKRSAERERLFREAFDMAAAGMLHAAPDGRILRANPRACDMLGRSGEELRSVSLLDIVHTHDVPLQGGLLQQLIQGERDRYRAECRIVRKDGQLLWIDGSLAIKREESGRPAYLIAVFEDISERKQAEEALRRAHDGLAMRISSQSVERQDHDRMLREQIKRALVSASGQRVAELRFRTIADGLPAMIGYWSRDLRCEFANLAYKEWFGLEPERIVGMPMQELLGEALFASIETYARLALEGYEQRFEQALRKADGSPACTDVRFLPDRDDDSGVRGFHVLATDITELRDARAELESANARLSRENTTDYLTGIANRRVFSRRIEEAAAQFRRSARAYGLILLDVDDFKLINDRHGHETGDRALQLVAGVLQQQARGLEDVVARVGGEEFAILCAGTIGAPILSQVAERIRLQITAATLACAEGTVRVTCSFGVAISQPGDLGWRSVYSRADAALYEAKAAGKNQVAGDSAARLSSAS